MCCCSLWVVNVSGDLPLWGILQWSCCASTPATAEASLDDVSGVDVDQKWLARWSEAGSVGTEWCAWAADKAVVELWCRTRVRQMDGDTADWRANKGPGSDRVRNVFVCLHGACEWLAHLPKHESIISGQGRYAAK